MATYKVIQDIEAEDKLVGPLSLRQFIYALITIACLFLGFKLATVEWFLAFPFIPPAVLFGFLAAPFGHDQPSEVWLLAKIRFALKPRRRIWDQSGVQELVTITAPKKVEQHLSDGLSQTEVKSRLQALANTIDSRGWVVKNVNVNLYDQPSYLKGNVDSDRLIDPKTLPQEVPGYGNTVFDDVLDENSSPTAQHFQEMIKVSAQVHKQQLIQNIQDNGGSPATGDNGAAWFAQQPASSPTNDDLVALDKIHREQSRPNPVYERMRKLQPDQQDRGERKKTTTISDKPMTPSYDPAIMQLANNDDLNVATIARQANKATGNQNSSNEVVISLH